MRGLIIYILFSSLVLVSCDKGLSPNLAEDKVGFGGIITFSGDWNPEITQTHVVVFKNPLLSVDDFNVFNLKFVSETIPNGSESYQYSTNKETALISTIEPGELSYIAVAQSIKDTITLNREDWIVVGLYYTENSSSPGSLILPESSYIDSINIHCDFNNLPAQPPGAESRISVITKQLNDIN